MLTYIHTYIKLESRKENREEKEMVIASVAWILTVVVGTMLGGEKNE
jgi:hypothetical protein